MTEARTLPCADALSREVHHWHAHQWGKLVRNVRRLQVRIVKAVQCSNRRKVQALQRLLAGSYSARMLAVRRVTENEGSRTAGVDGQKWSTPAEKMTGVKGLEEQPYRAKPLLRKYIPKKNGKLRPLGIPTMQDRAKQAVYLFTLDPIAETTADPNSYAFRRERSCADALEQAYHALYHPQAATWVLEGDIRGCFDQIAHEWLLAHIPINRTVLRQWLKAGYWEKQKLYPTEAGTPQGGIISPVLANMTLDGLEALLKAKYPRHKGLKVHLVRYADDFIITCSDRKVLEKEIRPLVAEFLRQRGLELSDEKTLITSIEDGFDFLGQTLRKFKGKLILQPSHQSQKILLTKVRTIVQEEGRHLSAYGLIRRLNPLLRGWANYHRHAASKQTFREVEEQVFQLLWRWALRRHRNKPKDWVYRHYFFDAHGRKRPFHAYITDEQGNPVVCEIFQPNRLPIRRHVKVIGAANPYDPTWEPYFEQRRYQRVAHELPRQPKLLTLFRLQQGLCPLCNQAITTETGWNCHHILWRVYGGGDEIENLVLLHPTCHQQLHNPHSDIELPRSRRAGVGDA
jgi:RNA-directed DNA polymerase